MQRQNTMNRYKKQVTESAQAKAISSRTEDTLASDPLEDENLDDLWLNPRLKEKERSRIQRQVKARRELERRLDEKRLKALVDDWCFDDQI